MALKKKQPTKLQKQVKDAPPHKREFQFNIEKAIKPDKIKPKEIFEGLTPSPTKAKKKKAKIKKVSSKKVY